MDERELLRHLATADTYPDRAAPEVLQTHISIVCLAGDRVYKLKKALRLPFLDFSTLERRRHFCREEVRLNRRLCPDVYLGTCALRATSSGLRFSAVGDDDGADVVETAVVMRRLPQERMLDRLLARGEVGAPAIAELAHMVATFHDAADRDDATRRAGDPDRLASLAAANFTEIAAIQDHGLDVALLAALARRSTADFTALLPRLRDRCARGRVVDGHGDLHARNVCMTAPPAIYDCIEFEPAFRCGDVATEIAFLAMDLRYRGAAVLAATFVAAYAASSGDTEVHALLPVLVGYRAMVRAKVAALAAAAPGLSPADREGAHGSARAHLQLAAAVAIEAAAPVWLLFCGPPGSGKSTLATALQQGTHWPLIATDRVRKELAGLAATERGGNELYREEHSDRTYREVSARATAATAEGNRVVLLDGNFASPARRRAAAEAATRAGARAVVVHVDVPAEVGRARTAQRAADPLRVSDAGPAEHDVLRSRFVVPRADEGVPVVAVDGTAPPTRSAAAVLTALLTAQRTPE